MIWTTLLLTALGQEPGEAAVGAGVSPAGICATEPCAEVLPGAVRFERPEGKPYAVGDDAGGERVGWVVLSNDVVDIKGYSGKPLSTLVGLDEEGVITGGKVVHHAEPILLVGIPESELHAFVGQYVGLHATEKVAVGGGAGPDARSVDVVSGATVTILAENRTILDSARMLAEDVGVIEPTPAVPGHWVEDDRAWTWDELVDEGVFGRLTVTNAEMGDDDDGAYVDLWFAVADAPQVGIALLGENEWRYQKSRLEPGQHLLVIGNTGPGSFKGSGFVRGGIFDRVRVEQGLRTVMFTDQHYANLVRIEAEGAPAIREGAIFRAATIDPGASFDLVFLGSRYDQKSAFSREFHAFRATHRVPRSVYALDGPDPESQIWRSAWAGRKAVVVGVVAYLLAVAGVFAGRRWTTNGMQRLQRLHHAVLLASFVGLGLYLHLQPSITQLLTVIGSLVHEWRWGLFLSDPLLFVTWIFIAAVTLVWGRGVFCGWTCPYGALSELVYRVARWVRIPKLELPDWLHHKAKTIRYGVLALLVVAFLVDAETGERLAEVEPFKSTFFVAPWTRHPALFAWWIALLGFAATTYRPFCRYLCPLGAALALPSSVRLSGPYRRDFCSKCKICTRGCEPMAIRPDGTIDPRECLSCMECESNWRSDQVCPPLVKARRDRERAAANDAPAQPVMRTMGARR